LSAAELAHLIDAANKVCDARFCKDPALMIMEEKSACRVCGKRFTRPHAPRIEMQAQSVSLF
jgi:hypothetical protein